MLQTAYTPEIARQHPTMRPTGLSFQALEQASYGLLTAHGQADAPPIDVEHLLHATGGRLEVYLDPIRMTGAPEVEIAGPGDYLVRVPHYHARPRRRFLIAGGIARYVLHSGFHTIPNRPAAPCGDPDARIHWEACAFASCLLLPRALLGPALAGDTTAHGLAYAFDVTETLVQNRIQAIRTIALDT